MYSEVVPSLHQSLSCFILSNLQIAVRSLKIWCWSAVIANNYSKISIVVDIANRSFPCVHKHRVVRLPSTNSTEDINESVEVMIELDSPLDTAVHEIFQFLHSADVRNLFLHVLLRANQIVVIVQPGRIPAFIKNVSPQDNLFRIVKTQPRIRLLRNKQRVMDIGEQRLDLVLQLTAVDDRQDDGVVEILHVVRDFRFNALSGSKLNDFQKIIQEVRAGDIGGDLMFRIGNTAVQRFENLHNITNRNGSIVFPVVKASSLNQVLFDLDSLHLTIDAILSLLRQISVIHVRTRSFCWANKNPSAFVQLSGLAERNRNPLHLSLRYVRQGCLPCTIRSAFPLVFD